MLQKDSFSTETPIEESRMWPTALWEERWSGSAQGTVSFPNSSPRGQLPSFPPQSQHQAELYEVYGTGAGEGESLEESCQMASTAWRLHDIVGWSSSEVKSNPWQEMSKPPADSRMKKAECETLLAYLSELAGSGSDVSSEAIIEKLEELSGHHYLRLGRLALEKSEILATFRALAARFFVMIFHRDLRMPFLKSDEQRVYAALKVHPDALVREGVLLGLEDLSLEDKHYSAEIAEFLQDKDPYLVELAREILDEIAEE